NVCAERQSSIKLLQSSSTECGRKDFMHHRSCRSSRVDDDGIKILERKIKRLLVIDFKLEIGALKTLQMVRTFGEFPRDLDG
ncbi:9549_t:CDS:1, partial [Acaulospora colombiana]